MVVVVDVAMATNKSISYIGICSSDIKTGSVATNTALSVDTVAINKHFLSNLTIGNITKILFTKLSCYASIYKQRIQQ